MSISDLYTDKEIAEKMVEVSGIIYYLNLSIESINHQIKTLMQSYDSDSLLLKVLYKRADELALDYLYFTEQLERYTKATSQKEA